MRKQNTHVRVGFFQNFGPAHSHLMAISNKLRRNCEREREREKAYRVRRRMKSIMEVDGE